MLNILSQCFPSFLESSDHDTENTLGPMSPPTFPPLLSSLTLEPSKKTKLQEFPLLSLPHDLIKHIFLNWLARKDILKLNAALTCRELREDWVQLRKLANLNIYRPSLLLPPNPADGGYSGHPSGPGFCGIYPLSNDFFITGDRDGMISIWDLNTPPGPFKKHEVPLNRIAHFQAHNGGMLFSHIDLRSLLTLSLTTSSMKASKTEGKHEYWLVSVSEGTIKIWSITINQPYSSFSSSSSLPSASVIWKRVMKNVDAIYSVLALRDGRRIASGSRKCIHLLNYWTGERKGSLNGHDSYIAAMIQLRNGNLASGSHDKTIRIWDVDTGECLRTLQNRLEVSILLELHDGTIASASSQRPKEEYLSEINIWNIETGLREKLLSSLGYNAGREFLHQLSNDQLVVSGFNICDIETGKARKVFHKHSNSDEVRGHAFMTRLPNDSLVSCSSDGCIVLWREI